MFCAHLVLVLLALALFGSWHPERNIWIDVAILTFSFSMLTLVAWISQQLDQYTAAFKKRRAASRKARLERKESKQAARLAERRR